jgi:hypothetical protein
MSSRGEQTVGIEILPEGGGEPELALAGKQQQRESCFRVYSLEFALLAGDREWLVARLKDLVGKSDEKSRGEFDNLIRYRDTLLKEEDQRLKAEELSQKATKDREELSQKAEELSQKATKDREELSQKAEDQRLKAEELSQKATKDREELSQKAEDQRLKALELSQKATKDIEELRLKAEGLSLRKQEMDLQQQNSGKCSHQIGHLVALHVLYFPCPTQRPRNQQEAHPTCYT